MFGDFYKGKKILVTGGTGLIGRPLVQSLIAEGAEVKIVSLDDKSRAPEGASFVQADLTRMDNAVEACQGMDYVFHLAGIKGSPKMTSEKPASFFVPTISFNTNMMEAARKAGVEKYLFTSSIGVYSPAEVFYEDDVWKTFPSVNDRFAGWAKRMGELQAEAYQIEFNWKDIYIVRPANVYGPYDNFDPENAMVIPSLVRRSIENPEKLVVWGDGSPVRDFIHARDVATGMLQTMHSGYNKPVNLGSGEGVSIKEIVETLCEILPQKPAVEWDTSKPKGDAKRLMDISRAKEIGYKPQVSLKEGISEVVEWFNANKDTIDKRYNVFTEGIK